MKHLHVQTTLLFVLAVLFLASCDDDEDARVPVFLPVTAEYFASCVDGKGWRYAESHEIKGSGTFAKSDYWSDLVGGGPTQYSFDGDSITVYMYLDAFPISGYRKQKYTYDEQSRRLSIEGDDEFTVVSVDENELCLIRHEGTTGDGERIYVYAVYRAMSQGELATVRRNYPYNLNTLGKEFPELPERSSVTASDFNRKAVGQAWKCVSAHEMMWTWRYSVNEFYDGETALKPVDYEITVDSIIEYTPSAEGTDTLRKAYPYVYRANGSYVDTGDDNTFYVISLTSEEMQTVHSRYDAARGKDVRLYCIYRNR